MANFRKTLLALGGAGVLAISMASSGAYAYSGLSHGDEADDEFLQQLQSGGNTAAPVGGANLAIPGSMSSGPSVQCNDVIASPAQFGANIVRYCRAHVR